MLEIPVPQSTEVLKRWFQETCLGLELQDDPFQPTRGRFCSVCSLSPVSFTAGGFFDLLVRVLEPYGLQAIGRMVAVIGFIGLVGQPVMQTWNGRTLDFQSETHLPVNHVGN